MHVPHWSIGERLRKAREDAGLSQEQLAATIGIHFNSVSHYENNRPTKPKPIVIRAWARATDVPEWWLWGSEAPADAEMSGRTSGWVHVVETTDQWKPTLVSGWIYVSPDQLSLDDALGLAA